MSPRFVVDTDVISETARAKPDPKVTAWLVGLDTIALTAITVYELARGIERLPVGKRRAFLDAWLARLLASEPLILAFDRDTALTAARLGRDARATGRGVDEHDLFILACAQTHGLQIATRNVEHFRDRGVPVYDPFSDVWAV